MAVKGVRLTAGSKVLADTIATEDAAVVELLRRAGAVIIGKTNTHEFADGAYTPTTHNPWDLSRIPGGFSGGWAAGSCARNCYSAIGSVIVWSIDLSSGWWGVPSLQPTAY